jgi:hypothetical protein
MNEAAKSQAFALGYIHPWQCFNQLFLQGIIMAFCCLHLLGRPIERLCKSDD